MSLVKLISLGQVVESITGRDLHTVYLVVGIQGRILLVSNGRGRSVKKPKKKNIRHIKLCERVFPSLAQKLEQKQLVSDEEIRAVLNLYKPDNL